MVLIAVKTRDGQPAFPPVSLNTTSEPPRCFLNVDSVLCLNDYRAPVTAWVVDATSGRVSYQGPTDLRVDGADLTVRQIGVASVATTQGQGVFGVGPRATTSWFVPGDGDIPPMRLTSPARRVSLPRKAPRILEAPPRPCSPLETAVSLHPRSRQALRLTKRSPTPVVSQPK